MTFTKTQIDKREAQPVGWALSMWMEGDSVALDEFCQSSPERSCVAMVSDISTVEEPPIFFVTFIEM
jgi:hypothetical protein